MPLRSAVMHACLSLPCWFGEALPKQTCCCAGDLWSWCSLRYVRAALSQTNSLECRETGCLLIYHDQVHLIGMQ